MGNRRMTICAMMESIIAQVELLFTPENRQGSLAKKETIMDATNVARIRTIRLTVPLTGLLGVGLTLLLWMGLTYGQAAGRRSAPGACGEQPGPGPTLLGGKVTAWI